jgi:hypothetical protein
VPRSAPVALAQSVGGGSRARSTTLRLAQTAEYGRGKQWAISGAHGCRQAVLLEQMLEDWPCLHRVGGEPRGTAQEKASVGIGARQGLAIVPIVGPELALEVGCPGRIGDLGV